MKRAGIRIIIEGTLSLKKYNHKAIKVKIAAFSG